MANNISPHMFKQMNQDLAFDKRDPNVYWEAMNMELINNGQTLSMVSTSGTETTLELTTISENLTVDGVGYYVSYGGITYPFVQSIEVESPTIRVHTNQIIIGLSALRNDLYIFTQSTNQGFNVVYRYDGTSVVVVYAAYLNMKSSNPLNIISNYENVEVQKLYWVDGDLNWFRTLNVSRENATTLQTMPSEFVDVATEVVLSTPVVVSEETNGSLKAGRIQYGYTLYNRSGQETSLSSLSAIYSIGKSVDEGGSPDELLSKSLRVEITDLDPLFDSIRVYSIHYDETGSTQAISIIIDEGISGDTYTFVDGGDLFVSTTTSDHLIALLGSRYKGGTLNTKKNRLFLGDYSVESFDIEFDARAFSYSSAGEAQITDATFTDGPHIVAADYSNVIGENSSLGPSYDSVNPDPSIYKFESNGITTGGTGPYVRYRHVSISDDPTISGQSFMKRGETYRIGIMFRDKYARKSPVIWVADTLVPYGGGTLNGTGVRLQVFLTDIGTEMARDAGAVGYSVLMVNRTYGDRSILGQGFIVPTYKLTDDNGTDVGGDYWRPNWMMRDLTKDNGGRMLDSTTGYTTMSGREEFWDLRTDDDGTEVRFANTTSRIMTMHSPDIDFNVSTDMQGTSVNILGYAPMHLDSTNGTKSTYEMRDPDGTKRFGRSHTYIKYKDNDDVLNPNEPLFYETATKLPAFFYDSWDSTDENFSAEAYHWRSYDNIQLHTDSEVVNEPLLEPSSLVNTGDTTSVDLNTKTFKNSNQVEEMTGYGTDGSDQGIKNNNTTSQKCVVITFPDTSWSTTNWPVTPLFDKFIDVTTQAITDRNLPIIDLKRSLANQYGGKSFETRRRNQYIEISDFKELSVGSNSTDLITTTGDCYIEDYYMKRQGGEANINEDGWHMYEMVKIKLESWTDTSNRYDQEKSRFDGSHDDCRTALVNSYKYNTAYSHLPTAIINIPEPYNFQQILNFDTGIIATDIKFNNEIIDSWTNFLPFETMQLDGEYGKLTKLQKLNGELYAFQPSAISALSISPRVQVQADDGINLELGTGQVLDDFNYITTMSGSLNKWSIYSLNDDIYYYDYYNKAMSSLKKGSLSTMHGLQEITTKYHLDNKDNIINDNPLLNQGVVTTYDSNNKSVYITMQGTNPITFSFNVLVDGFVSLHSFQPTIGIDFNGEYITTNSPNILYNHIHNYDNTLSRKLYDNTFTSYITILSSKDPIQRKKFGNVELDIKDDNVFNQVEAWNDYQTSGIVPLYTTRSGNFNKHFNKWRLSIPREENTRNFLADTKLWLKLIHDPDQTSESGKIKLVSNIVLNNLLVKYVTQ